MLEKLIQKVNKLSSKNQIQEMEEAEKLLENYINNNPKNIEMWLRLAVLELISPLVDEEKSIYCINKVLQLDVNNIDALLLLCCIYHFMLGGIDDELFNKISNLKTNNKEQLSMIEYVKSWYYDRKDYSKYEECLIKSINLFSYHVYNYIDLARFYIKNERIAKAKELIKKALENITLVYPMPNKDYTDVQEYFNELLKGVHTTTLMIESIQELLKETENLYRRTIN